jgi:hypothetical protein
MRCDPIRVIVWTACSQPPGDRPSGGLGTAQCAGAALAFQPESRMDRVERFFMMTMMIGLIAVSVVWLMLM